MLFPDRSRNSDFNKVITKSRVVSRSQFPDRPETFWAYFGCHNSLCIFKAKASRSTKLCSYFNFLFPLQHMKRQALQDKRGAVSRMAFRARKVFGTFRQKRATGPSCAEG